MLINSVLFFGISSLEKSLDLRFMEEIGAKNKIEYCCVSVDYDCRFIEWLLNLILNCLVVFLFVLSLWHM